MSNNYKLISVIVPCYNEESNIEKFFAEASTVLQSDKYLFEYIFINDGSRDNTILKLKDIYNYNKNITIKIIDFSRNFGKESAILAGLNKSCGDYITIIDADLQQNPKYINDMLIFLENNTEYDMVACYQNIRIESKLLKLFKTSFYKIINKLSDIDFKSDASDFRMFKNNVKDAIISLPEYHRFSKGIFSWIGFNTYYMPYEVRNRNSGETKWSFTKLMGYAITGIIGYSTKPLRLSTYIGFIVSCLSFLYLIVVIFNKLFNLVDIPGYTTIVSLILFISGVQMIFLGVIGEYISQIFIQGKNRPHYIIRESLERENSKNM